MAKNPRQRADQLVFEQGLAESREQARRLIMAGKVMLALNIPGAPPQLVPKPGHPYPADTAFALLEPEPYVSRGAYKLITILDHFKLDVADFVCLDAGASTGGFTDVLLRRGAREVVAVDVGYGQLAWKLRTDDRVVNMERTNIRNVTVSDIGQPVDFISIDVSFISLLKIMPAVVPLLAPGGVMVSLIKPQFEAGREHVGKGGIVREAMGRWNESRFTVRGSQSDGGTDTGDGDETVNRGN